MTFEDALLDRARGNALNLVRLALATLVIVDHSWPLGGFGLQPPLGNAAVSEWAVAGFFCISGFLIAASRTRLSFPRFMWHRALRILPGFWACLAVIAFLFAPIAALATSDTYSLSSGVSYLVHNAALYIYQAGIDGTLQTVPYPTAWDGSLWTLVYEFLAYLAAGIVLTGWLRRRPAATSTVLLAVVLVLGVAVEGHITTQLYIRGLYLGAFFLAGMAVFGFSRRVPVSTPILAVSVALLVAVMVTGISAVWAAIPLTYVLLWAGAVIPVVLSPETDISYGVYIYAFPVQQSLALAGAHELGLVVFMALSVACTLPPAWASWHGVEKPAQRLKRWMGTPQKYAVTTATPATPLSPPLS